MASTTPHTIVLSDQPVIIDELLAAGVAITPGMLLELASATTIKPHATAAGNAQALFAVEKWYADGGTVAAIDTAYGTAETVRYLVGNPGDQVYAWLVDGGSVNAGDMLVSAGSVGALTAYAAGTALAPLRVVGKALEAKTASGAAARLKVEIV